MGCLSENRKVTEIKLCNLENHIHYLCIVEIFSRMYRVLCSSGIASEPKGNDLG